MTFDRQHSFRNTILSTLPRELTARLGADFEIVHLVGSQVIQLQGEPMRFVHFVESGLVSVIMRFEAGDAAEVYMIGREGFAGLPLVLGANTSPNEAIVQSAGTAIRISGLTIRAAMASNVILRNRLLRYTLDVHTQACQIAACASRHSLVQRLVRWLLMAHDRTENDAIPVTQDSISMMLGVRRSGITVAAGALQEANVIKLSRGRITVLDRQGLEENACECYRTGLSKYRSLTPNLWAC
jgi:CRP-like cAMP-binding protein